MNGGKLEEDLSVLLYSLIASVVQTQKTGSLTLRITASPGATKKGRDRRIADVVVSAKMRENDEQIGWVSPTPGKEPVILYAGQIEPLADMQLKIEFEADDERD